MEREFRSLFRFKQYTSLKREVLLFWLLFCFVFEESFSKTPKYFYIWGRDTLISVSFFLPASLPSLSLFLLFGKLFHRLLISLLIIFAARQNTSPKRWLPLFLLPRGSPSFLLALVASEARALG